MSKSDFLHNLKTARNLFIHRVQTDHPGLDPETVEAQLGRAAIWLTPSSMRGFKEKDFPELSERERAELTENVGRFVKIANEVPADKPATQEQIRSGMQCFLKILTILTPYLPSGGELKQTREALEAITFPDAVLTWDFELGADSTDDPAVWVWIFVSSETAGRDDFSELATRIQELIRESLTQAGVKRWPYVRFRTASEQRALSG